MLNEFSTEQINRIADLAKQTRDVQFNQNDRTMISRAATRWAGDGETGGEIDEALDNPEILEGTVSNERLHEQTRPAHVTGEALELVTDIVGGPPSPHRMSRPHVAIQQDRRF